ATPNGHGRRRTVEIGRGGCRSLLDAERRRFLPEPPTLEIHPGLAQAERRGAAGADEIALHVALDGAELFVAHRATELEPRLPQIDGEQVVVALGSRRGVD